MMLNNRGFVSSPEKIELWIRITQPVTIGDVLRVISISHDEKADRGRETDTLKKGIKRRVFVISIDQSGYEYHKKSEVSPGDRQKRQKSKRLASRMSEAGSSKRKSIISSDRQTHLPCH